MSQKKYSQPTKNCLVTGATSGIGLAISSALLKKGFTVYGTGRSVETGSVANGIHWLQMELGDEDSVTRAIDYLKNQVNHLDLLVNNAGIGMIGPIEYSSDKEVKKLFDVNVFGMLRVCRMTLPLLRATSKSKIVNISSIAGSIGLPYRGIYSASKFALEGISEALRTEMRPFGVYVCMVQPGDVKTAIAERRVIAQNVTGSVYDEQMTSIVKQINEEVANAISPEKVASLVARIATSNSSQFRYRVGKPLQIVSIALKRFLPYKLFEALLNRFYNDK